MAILASITTGNLTTAATWAVVHTGTFQTLRATQETGTTVVSTALQSSTNFTVAANTVVDAVLLKHSNSATTFNGTITVQIYNATTSTVVATMTTATSSTVVPTVISSPNWFQFKFSSSVTLATANNYQIRMSASQGSVHTFYRRSATAADWTFGLRTTTTQAPATGDILLVASEITSTARTDFTVTNNNTNTALLLGNGTSGTAGVEVSYLCKLVNGTAASTNYSLRVSGDFQFNTGSTFECGNTTTGFPQSSTATFEIYQPATGRFTWFIRSTVNYFTYLTAIEESTGKRAQAAALSANISAGATSFTISGSPTNWKNGDEIVIPTTERDYTQVEYRTMNANESAGTVSISAATTYAHARYHDFWSLRPSMVANLTKCIRFQGTSTSLLVGTLTFGQFTQVNFDGVSFQYFGTINTNATEALDQNNNYVYATSNFKNFVLKDYSGSLTHTNNQNIFNLINYTAARALATISYAYYLNTFTASLVQDTFTYYYENLYSYGGSGTVDGRIRFLTQVFNGNTLDVSSARTYGIGIYINGLNGTGVAGAVYPLLVSTGGVPNGYPLDTDLDATVSGCNSFGGGFAISIQGLQRGIYLWGLHAIKNAMSGIQINYSIIDQSTKEIFLSYVTSQENTTTNIDIYNKGSSVPLTISSINYSFYPISGKVNIGVSSTNPTTTVMRFANDTNCNMIIDDIVGVTSASASSFCLPETTLSDTWNSTNIKLTLDCSKVTSSTITFTKIQQATNWGYSIGGRSKLYFIDNSGNKFGYLGTTGVYYFDSVNYYQTSPSLVLENVFSSQITPPKLLVIPANKRAKVTCWVYATVATGTPSYSINLNPIDLTKLTFLEGSTFASASAAVSTGSWVQIQAEQISSYAYDIFAEAFVVQAASSTACTTPILKVSDWRVELI